MESLERYAKHFDAVYREYGEARYRKILELVNAYDPIDIQEYVKGPDFAKAARVIDPLTAIKNYKSQVPYPHDVARAIACIVDMRKTAVATEDVLSGHYAAIARLLDIEGFQLPTVSAILHFCHPRHFPIVDVNVQAACELLNDLYSSDFEDLASPRLPAPATSSKNKIGKYRCFIRFIDRIIELQKGIEGNPDYRYIDKSLMVFGVSRFRKQAEALC